jgi:hypothetical protein
LNPDDLNKDHDNKEAESVERKVREMLEVKKKSKFILIKNTSAGSIMLK